MASLAIRRSNVRRYELQPGTGIDGVAFSRDALRPQANRKAQMQRTASASGLAQLLMALALTAPVIARAQQIQRFETSGSAPRNILEGALLPAGAEVLMLSGQTATLPDALAKPVGPEVTAAQLGDTYQQTANVLARIKKTLERRGWAMSDVVRLTVFLVGDPAKGGRMDYEGMNQAYAEFFSSSADHNLVTRATVQVVALAQPAFLVEVEATAARVPKRP
jgi:2-iminobutanoate/2-iminopropanoate deaminase